ARCPIRSCADARFYPFADAFARISEPMPGLDIPHVLQADGLITTTIAILLFFIGRRLNQRFEWLRHYSIPEPEVGGLFCALVVCVLYYGFDRQEQFTLDARDVLLQ